jgi:hypothetical protein
MTNEHQRTVRHCLVDHLAEVPRQPLERHAAFRSATRTPVRALVPEDQAGSAREIAALEVPTVLVQRVSVREHHRQR